MLKISYFSHRQCHAHAQSLPGLQQVDPRARMRWKEDMFRHGVESRIIKILPGLAGILIRKMPSDGLKTLRWPLFAGLYLSNPSSVSREPGTLRKRVTQAFQRYQERQNPTSGARPNMCANTDKKREKTR